MSTAILILSLTWGSSLPASEILSEADARIARYRTGQAVLRLIGPDGQVVPAGESVILEQTGHAFLFGSNIFSLNRMKSSEDNAAYARRYAELLNYATLPFYWWSYQARQDQPAHARIEEVAKWCREHRILCKGHPLAWNWVDPKWLPDDPALVMQKQLQRIEIEVDRFKGQIDIWDVVNEATHYDRPEPLEAAPKLTTAIRQTGVGEYVRSAFRAARRANPKATLIINDYRVDEAFAEQVIKQLKNEDGLPLYDVIGIQSHQHGGAWPVDKIWEVCERFAVFGKPLHFTETTFVSGEQGWDLKKQRKDPGFVWASTPEGERRQAEDVARFYTVLFSHPAVQAITWWDFSDQHAWQGAPAGLLRSDMSPKPAYDALKTLIKEKWWTARVQTSTADRGMVDFRGFFGRYRLTTGNGWTGEFEFHRDTEKPIVVRLQ